MKEDLLHYLWKFKNFETRHLQTTQGEGIQILNAGQHNTDAGPDFLNAQIQIGETKWAGSVELHIKSSDWEKHKHTPDKAYKNVVLHVVYEDDLKSDIAPIIPTLELKNYIHHDSLLRYKSLSENQNWIPCEELIEPVSSLKKILWVERMAVERLEEKAKTLSQKLNECGEDWNELFHRLLFRNFGFNTNSQPFEILAERIPYSIILKNINHLLQTEALLFGGGGLLDADFKGDYPNQLKKEYAYQAKKFNLQFHHPILWKFMRTRPVNFPSIRISQLAGLVSKHQSLFSQILEVENATDIKKLFKTEASEYWNNHYRFDEEAKETSIKNLGENSIQNIAVNTVVSTLYTYGFVKDNQIYKEKALALLESLKPEQNNITKKWAGLGFENSNAQQSQGLLNLKKRYCDNKKCLSCSLGVEVLGRQFSWGFTPC
ncbi:MAG: DUF2851 family protein [Bacteroidetes bacterium]|nr:DUF2851 family protein [Bacteroidota bacterium]